jgi:dUTP pyrophosphatase
MKVRIKKLSPDAEIPRVTRNGSTGMALVATSILFDEYGAVEYGTGLSIEIPEGYIGMIFPRGINAQKDLVLSTSIKIIYPGDTNEVILKFKPSPYFAEDAVTMDDGRRSDTFDYVSLGKEHPDDPNDMQFYTLGDRIGHLIIIPVPVVEWIEIYDSTVSEQLHGGFGTPNTSM